MNLNQRHYNDPGGHLLIDNSPALGGKGLFEADTFTCTHCQCVVVKNKNRTRERYHCRGCNHLLCDNCAAEKIQTGICVTMVQKFDQMLERAERQAHSVSVLP
jgi:hypothetical protein